MARDGYMTREKFEKDIAGHAMTVLRDDGVYRHLRCMGKEGSIHWFEVLTWHGRLCITGDMGTFVFNRLDDMFEFFRRGDGDINAGYWAEKVDALDRHGSLTHWSERLWREAVADVLAEVKPRLTKKEWKALREAVDDEVVFDDEDRAVESAHDFKFDGRQIFYDMWEHNCQEWSPRFIWCLYAIVWTIQQYDQRKAVAA